MAPMNPALNTISQTLAADLGPQLEAVFLFGRQAVQSPRTAVSPPHLLLVISPDANLHAVRESFHPLWQEHKTVLKQPPLVATRQALRRHLELNPHLALDMLQHGLQLAGQPMPANFFRTRVNPHELYAHFAQELLAASAALSQTSSPEDDMRLNDLVQQICARPVRATETGVARFTMVQQALTAVLNQLPAASKWSRAAQTGPTSADIPGLQAIYTENNKNIFVFNQLTPRHIGLINWETLAQHLPQADGSLHVTTVAQFCLLGLYEKALDLRFNKYQHKWGIPFLARLTPSSRQILRQAARTPSHILVNALPHSFLTAANTSDDTLHKLIHDYQNRMLNIQLENELLFRLGLIPAKFVPPEPLPERDTSAKQRLTAILQHLEWWADFYQSALQTES
ncbi:MAG: hypothetical protein IPM53_13750 [Anaerolineaceae bacterium]|nr:hypothetical protein [Anaerolineaceae bacterium]